MTDQDIIVAIRSGGKSFEQTSQRLLNDHIGMMNDIKTKLNLSISDAKDLYADALSALLWNVRTGKYKGESKLSTYLYRIFYNKSVDHIRHLTTNKNEATVEMSEKLEFETPKNDERRWIISMDASKMKEHINSLGTPCKGIIMDWAFWGYGMKEIAERNDLVSADKAKKNKYSCLQKLRKLLKAKNLL